jgi:hypothetical protein
MAVSNWINLVSSIRLSESTLVSLILCTGIIYENIIVNEILTNEQPPSTEPFGFESDAFEASRKVCGIHFAFDI